MTGRPAVIDTGPASDVKSIAPRNKQHFRPAVICFVSGGRPVSLGNIAAHSDKDVQVAFTTKHTGTDLPYLGFRVKFRRSDDTVDLQQNSDPNADAVDFHTVLFRYLHGEYVIEHHLANKAEKTRFLNITNNSTDAQNAIANDKLYIIKFSPGDKQGAEVKGIGSSLVGKNEEVQNAYHHLSSAVSSNVVDLYLWEYETLASNIKWMLENQAERLDPLLHYYLPSKKTTKPQARVQWGAIRPRDINMDRPFERRTDYHNFDDFTVMQGNSEAYEQMHFFDLSKELRSLKISMAVLRPKGSNGDYFFGFIYVNDWERYQRLFDPLDKVLITWAPPPEIKPIELKAEGEKDPIDDAPGWSGIVMDDNALSSHAPLMIMLRRPGANRVLCDKIMPAAEGIDQEMPVQRVYIKTFPSAITVKARLKAGDKHRSFVNKTPAFDEKRRVLVGRDLTVKRHDDLLEGIPEEKIQEITAGLNPSQLECFTKHCRDVHHGINLILGPFGSGKTVLVSKLCHLQKAQNENSKIFVTASSNTACDATVERFEDSDLMIVRAHALSLERESLLGFYFEAGRDGKLTEASPLPEDYEPPIRPQKKKALQKDEMEGAETIESAEVTEDEHVPDHSDEHTEEHTIEVQDNDVDKQAEEAKSTESQQEPEDESDENDLLLKATLDVMKLCEEKYDSRLEFEYPKDTRMRKVEVSIHTWMLKFAGVIESRYAVKLIEKAPSDDKGKIFEHDPCAEFRFLYDKSKTQKLNLKEWESLKKSMVHLSQMVLRAADVVIATTVQGQMDLLKDIVFDHVIVDEASVLTHFELLCAWRGDEKLTLIGDLQQLATTVLSTQQENPFALIQGYGPFQRFADLGLRVFVLRHVMRMTAGLEAISNKTFYNNRLICGPGTSPDDPKRQLSQLIHRKFQEIPILQRAPEDLVYPIFVDLPSTCISEKNGTSKMNLHNISCIIDMIDSVIGFLDDEGYKIKDEQFGIVSPYAAQVRATKQALREADLNGVRVGVTESWQGGEVDVLIVDFVRAKKNDQGALGFLTKKERLNVLISRQKQFLIVVGDMTCCETSSEPSEPVVDQQFEAAQEDNEAADANNWDFNDKKNSWVVKVLTWFKEHGRILPVKIEELSEDYIKFSQDEAETDASAPGGWGNDGTGGKEEEDEEDEEEAALKKKLADIQERKKQNKLGKEEIEHEKVKQKDVEKLDKQDEKKEEKKEEWVDQQFVETAQSNW